MPFKKNFLWGAATSSYQIEGAAYEDGKSLNIWDVFCRQDGKITGYQNGDTACDHYHRIKEDVKLMKEMGLNSYRFSVSWSRILPDGTGAVNQKGIDFYNALIDELIKNGIEPLLTIYHWDLPYCLSQQGGWLNKKSSDWFYEFAKVVAVNFSDRVKYFFTLNEPECFIGHGYSVGQHAPGYKLSDREVLNAMHNALLAHGKGVSALRKYAHQPVKIGIAACGSGNFPLQETKEDIEATNKSYDDIDKTYFFKFTPWLDPIIFGRYPEKLVAKYKEVMPLYSEDEMKIISQPIDFIALNIYRGDRIKSSEKNEYTVDKFEDGYPMTALNWEITPLSMYWVTKYIYNKYKMPIMISENGLSSRDIVSIDNKVHDPQRSDFMARYLKELKRSADEGTDIFGYMHWSLMDNFEWSFGYNERFGLIYVDYATQKRTIKDSAYYYRQIIESNGEIL